MFTWLPSQSNMNTEEFTKAFASALTNEKVIGLLKGVLTDALSHDLSLLQDNCEKLKKSVVALQESNEGLQKQVASFKAIMKTKDEEIAHLKETVEEIKFDLDNLEQNSRRNSLRISGLKENTDESLLDTTLKFFNETMKITPPIVSNNIERIHRIGTSNGKQPNNKPRTVLVKFNNYSARQKIFSQRSQLRKNERGAEIYINEDLTKARSNLLWHARKEKRDRKINDCWTFDGNLMIKTKVNKILRINNIHELKQC